MKRWTVETRNLVVNVEARDQWEAFDALRDERSEDFGLLVVARREDAKDGDEIPVRTSMLFGRWGRPDIARLFIAVAVAEGLPDTSDVDCVVREAVE